MGPTEVSSVMRRGSLSFPFYWTREPKKIKDYPMRLVDLGDLFVVETLNALPRRLPACGLVDCLPYEDCD